MPMIPIQSLGEPRFPSPLSWCVDDQLGIPARIERRDAPAPSDDLLFEIAGPRRMLFFDPRKTRAGIVTCGGLCPGINNVIRSLCLELKHGYGVGAILGFREGYKGLDPVRGPAPIELTRKDIEDIHKEGGTILGTSRGPVDTATAVDNLIRLKIDILFTVGGDGTMRGGDDLFQEANRRGYPISIVGIPKTIDNDVAFISRTFGYLTAVEEACRAIDCAHTEAHSVHNGISIVKLMGRHSGFIAAGATVASQDVNFTLIPELPFRLDGPNGLLAALKARLLARRHAVIVVAEGAGQDLLENSPAEKDASGNIKLRDIGTFLRDKIECYLKEEGVPMVMRYFDPSYMIRSRPADSEDAILCDLFARNAVHAAMAGKTGLVISLLHDQFVHVPMPMLARHKKYVDPNSVWWHAVLATTGQPARFE